MPFERGDIIVPRREFNRWPQFGLRVFGVDPDGTLHAYPLGGGFHYEFSPERVAFHDFVVVPPGTPATFNETWFHASWLGKDYPGWSNGKLWNGWAIPFFELPVGKEYARDTRLAPNWGVAESVTRYNQKRDCFITIYREGLDREPEVDESQFITAPGKGPIKVYSIGGGSWTWEEVEGSVKDWRPK